MTGSPSQAEDPVEACFREAQTLCGSRGLTLGRLPDAPEGYLRLQVDVAGNDWHFDVACSTKSLTRLPTVSLCPPRQLLAHVAYDGVVCVNDAQGLSLDLERQPEVVAYTVGAAIALFEKSAADAASGLLEFYNELEGYWSGLPKAAGARAAIEVDSSDRLVTAYASSRNKAPFWYFNERGATEPVGFRLKGLAAQRALFLSLDAPIQPPAYPDKLEASFIETILSKLQGNQLGLWQNLVGPSKNGPRQVALLLSVPRAAGGRSLLGISFRARAGKVDAKGEVRPLAVRRQTGAYMRERGGASLDLLGKHVVVFGCGAVGSEVADTLASAGVGRLTLVDFDTFTEDNVFRHVLGPVWIGATKVGGLRFELERQYPGLKVVEADAHAENWLAKHGLSDVDGVVVALGLPTLERVLARRLRKASRAIPLVFTWLEPLDLGGHSVLVASSGAGCLDCLYRNDDGGAVLYPRTAFLEPDQHVSRNLTGCASVFVPFGALQSRRTAMMAAEHMLSALLGGQAPSYRFWVGDGTTATAQGLRMTPWWHRAPTTTALDANASAFGRPCAHCRGST